MSTATVEFRIPHGFTEFLPAENNEEAYEAVLDRLGEAARTLTTEQRRDLTLLYAAASTALDTLAPIWSGSCAGTVDGRLSTATLTVAEIATGAGVPPATAAAGLMQLLTDPQADGTPPKRQVSRLTAPAGPVVVTLEPGPGLLRTDGGHVPVLSAKAYLPMPARDQGVLLVELATPDIDHWADIYAPLFSFVVQSIRFPDERSNPAIDQAPGDAVPDPPGAAPTTDPFGTALHT
ncbi:hypothetical protein [Kitasatospora sp. NPDC093679]|uniref:hypothetical protein n=1 Tax=Kitasatospora sp. NPDC093679 TaxID=3154983 RepID=UPI00341D1E9A